MFSPALHKRPPAAKPYSTMDVNGKGRRFGNDIHMLPIETRSPEKSSGSDTSLTMKLSTDSPRLSLHDGLGKNETPPKWDFPQNQAYPHKDRVPSEWFEVAQKLMIMLTMVFVLSLVFFGGSISLLTFHLIAAGFGASNKTLNQNLTNKELYSRCVIKGGGYLRNSEDTGPLLVNNTNTYNVTFLFDEGAATYWAFPLLVTILTPEVLTIIHAIYIIITSRKRELKWTQLILVSVIEIIQMGGLALLSFYILPLMGPFAGISMTSCTALVPALLNLLTPSESIIKKYSWLRRLWLPMHFVSLFALSTIFAAPFARIKGWDADNKMGFLLGVVGAIAVIMISAGFIDNYISWRSYVPKALKQHMLVTKRGPKEANPYLSLITGPVKMGTIIAVFFGAVVFHGQLPYITETGYRVKTIIHDHEKFFGLVTTPYAHPDHANSFMDNFSLITGNQTILCWPYHSFTWFNGAIGLSWGLVSVHVLSSIITVLASVYACKAAIQNVCMVLPLGIFVPVICLSFTGYSESFDFSPSFWNLFKPLPFELYQTNGLSNPFSGFRCVLPIVWSIFFLVTLVHIWFPDDRRLKPSNLIFSSVTYYAPFIDRSMLLLRRRDFIQTPNETADKSEISEEGTASGQIPLGDDDLLKKNTYLYVCTTLWHETTTELRSILRSLLKLDRDQCSREFFRERQIQDEIGSLLPDNDTKTGARFDEEYYKFEVHIMFDDAFLPQTNPGDPLVINQYVQDFKAALKDASVDVYNDKDKISSPEKVSTPYGGQLIWNLPESNCKMVAHLKCKQLVRNRKRWSQVMYMYYLLTYKLGLEKDEEERKQKLKSSFILTLDGDVDFQPEAALRLVDFMTNNPRTGSVCGRIHPLGSGPSAMIWYQQFEYAVGHWLQKAAEDVFGCVLCSPGCFALFRGEALVDSNIMSMYKNESLEAIDYVQHDQGEDRWLCTLLLQQGWGIRYAAAADAYTFAPEGLVDFYQQRRRWVPSTMANQFDLLRSWSQVLDKNDQISSLYMVYQMFMMCSTLLGPGAIFLMLLGALKTVFYWDIATAFIVMGGTVVFFAVLCFQTKAETQLKAAGILTIISGLVMTAVLVALALQARSEGITSPNVSFLLLIIGSFVIAGLLHPQEILCLVSGIIYFLAIPSTYMLLNIYTVCNVNVVAWGTREAKSVVPETTDDLKSLPKRIWFKLLAKIGALPAKEQATIELEKLKKQADKQKGKSRTRSHRKLGVGNGDYAYTRLDTIGEGSETEDTTDDSDDDLLHKPPSSRSLIQSSRMVEPPQKPAPAPELLFHPSCKDNTKLEDSEQTFWLQFVKKYLYPIQSEDQPRVKADLKELRNAVVLLFSLVNVFFILIVFLLELRQGELSFKWPLSECSWDLGETVLKECSLPTAVDGRCCGQCKLNQLTIVRTDNKTKVDCQFSNLKSAHCQCLQVEPVSIAVFVFFLLLLSVQFFGMLLHRFQTWMHLVATTTLKPRKSPQSSGLSAKDIREGLDALRNANVEENPSPVTSRVPNPRERRINDYARRKDSLLNTYDRYKHGRYGDLQRELSLAEYLNRAVPPNTNRRAKYAAESILKLENARRGYNTHMNYSQL